MEDEEKEAPLFEEHFASSKEKAAAERALLFRIHQARGSLGTYYYLYPDDAPPGWFTREQAKRDREREQQELRQKLLEQERERGRERER